MHPTDYISYQGVTSQLYISAALSSPKTSLYLSQIKVNDINLNDRNQMQNDTENEIGRSLFPFIHGLRIVISFDL